MKTLRDKFFELFEPKSPDEKRFVKKHVIAKTPDANGNKDDVFQAKNIKMFDRHKEHGYNPGEDEKVYEEVEQLDELSRKTLASYVKKAGGMNMDSVGAHAIDYGRSGDKDSRRMTMNRARGLGRAGSRLAKEDVDLQELSKSTLARYAKMATMRAVDNMGAAHAAGEDPKQWARSSGHYATISRRRERGAKKAIDKLAKEDVNLQELSRSTLASYVKRSSDDLSYQSQKARGHEERAGEAARSGRRSVAKAHDDKMYAADKVKRKRYKGITMAADKLAKEDVNLQELSKNTLQRYISHSAAKIGYHGTLAGTHRSLAGRHDDPESERQRNSKEADHHATKAIKRYGGVNTAARRLAKAHEEVDLQELSHRTLRQYTLSSTEDALRARDANRGALEQGRNGEWHAKKEMKRRRGLGRAIHKMSQSPYVKVHAKEEAELQELSKQTLHGYIQGASKSIVKAHSSAVNGNGGTETISKRQRGITTAVRRWSAKDAGHKWTPSVTRAEETEQLGYEEE